MDQTLALPTEILGCVFDNLTMTPDLLHATQVSRRWRTIAQSHRTYWQNLILVRANPNNMKFLETRLRSCSNPGVHLTVMLNARPTLIQRVALSERLPDIVAEHSHRVRSFRLDAADGWTHVAGDILTTLCGPTASLQHLDSLHISIPWRHHHLMPLSLEFRTLVNRMPNLRVLTLQCILLDFASWAWTATLPSLQWLHYHRVLGVDDAAMRFDRIFAAIPNVRHLHWTAPLQLDASQLHHCAQLSSLSLRWEVLCSMMDDVRVQNLPELAIIAGNVEWDDYHDERYLFAGLPPDTEVDMVYHCFRDIIDLRELSTGMRRSWSARGLCSDMAPLPDLIYRRAGTITTDLDFMKADRFGTPFERLHTFVLQLDNADYLGGTEFRAALEAPNLRTVRFERLPTDPLARSDAVPVQAKEMSAQDVLDFLFSHIPVKFWPQLSIEISGFELTGSIDSLVAVVQDVRRVGS